MTLFKSSIHGACESDARHLITFNAQYSFEIVFKRLLDKVPNRTAFCVDSRPVFYLLSLLAPVELVQGSASEQEILCAAAQYNALFVIGGCGEWRQADRIMPSRVYYYQRHFSIDEGIAPFLYTLRERPQKIFAAIFLGAPKQDLVAREIHAWAQAQSPEVCAFTVGLGGALDMWQGRQRRAPKIVQAFCLEGVWRLVSQPTGFRLKRLAVSLIGLLVLPVALRRIRKYANAH